MGDVAMTVPVLRVLSQSYPDLKITVLSRAFLKPLFEDIPNVNFYAADVYGKHKGVLGLYRLAKELKAQHVDAVADFHNVTRSKILRFYLKWLGVSKLSKIDKGRVEKKTLIKTDIKNTKQLKSTFERYTTVLNHLDFTIDLKKHQFPAKKPLSNKLLDIVGQKKTKWIGIAPFAQYASKSYPLDLIEQVIESLTKKGYQLLLFGGGDKEISLLHKIAQKHPKTINVAGIIKLKDELILISHLDIMLAMDSANAHLAAMQGIPVVTLWGATHPYAGFMPFNQPFENALLPDLDKYPKLPCSIYGNKICTGYEDAMRSISSDKVVSTLLAKL
jgi:ADP-heptose:LPS heptosyltransferase